MFYCVVLYGLVMFRVVVLARRKSHDPAKFVEPNMSFSWSGFCGLCVSVYYAKVAWSCRRNARFAVGLWWFVCFWRCSAEVV